MSVHEFWNGDTLAALFNHLWQSTAVVLVAWLLTLVLKRNAARVRYSVWMFASIKFLVPFALLASLGTHWAKPVVGRTAGSVLYTAADEISQPFQPAHERATNETMTARSARIYARSAPAIAVVWCFGMVLVFGLWMANWRRTRQAAMEAMPICAGREVEALRRAERTAGIRRPIPLLLSSRAIEPGVFGVMKPVLLWPAGVSEQLTDAQVEAIVAHEVEHVRRCDNLTAAIHMLVQALFWFHPVIRWMGARLTEERERACDEKVVEQSARPEAYAESILKVCAFCLDPPAPCVSGVSGSDLKERIRRIMTDPSGVGLDALRILALCSAAGLVIAAPVSFGVLHAMQAPSPQIPDVSPDVPKFEVATIKPAAGSDNMSRMMLTPDGTEMDGVQIQMLLRQGFNAEDDRIIGAPGWVKTNRFDIRAKVAPEDAAKLEKLKPAQRGSMMIPVLVDRFNLKYHHEMRELPSYSLVIAKDGPKMKASEDANPDAALKPGEPGPDSKPGDPGTKSAPRQHFVRMMGPGHVESEGSSMEILTRILSQQLGRTVVDRTGLTGNYVYRLDWTPDEAPSQMPGGADGMTPPGDIGNIAAGPSLLTALQEQMGLKLESGKGPVDVIVIDHIDLPSQN